MNCHTVIGLRIAATDYAGAVRWILDKASLCDRAYAVEAANTHVAALAKQSASFRETMDRFDLILPDGMPLIWSINANLDPEHKLKDRVYGPTLMLKVLEATSGRPELSHFLLGGSQGTLEKLKAVLAERFADTTIAGSHSPPFGDWSEQDQQNIENRIRKSGAPFVWVGLGCPKQEHWIARNLDRLPNAVYFGVGAAFAFHAGEVRQAPPMLQKLGLEWIYRLAMEPRRLFRRYLIYNSLFVWYWLKDRMSD